jgi:hypothetical protein
MMTMLGYERKFLSGLRGSKPVSIAERSKASTVFGRSNIGIAGSNPARDMDVCVLLCCVVLCR